MMKFLNKHFFFGIGTGILLTVLALIGASFLLAAMFFNQQNIEKHIAAPSFPTDALEYNLVVRSLDDRDFYLTDAKGKVVFLNFWATWCVPCLAEMPSIQRLYEKTKDDGIIFLIVSQEDNATVSQYLSGKGYTFPVYTLQGEPPPNFKSDTIPATFILSPDGKVAFKHIGAAKWDDEKSIAFLRALNSHNSPNR